MTKDELIDDIEALADSCERYRKEIDVLRSQLLHYEHQCELGTQEIEKLRQELAIKAEEAALWHERAMMLRRELTDEKK